VPIFRKTYFVRFATLVLCFTLVLMLQAQSGNPKVDNYLKALATFSNADSARVAAEAARFTASEKEQLKSAIRNPAYSSQVARLVGTIQKLNASPMPIKRDVVSLRQEQARRIEGVNLRLKGEVQKLQAMSAQLSAQSRSVLGKSPKITSVSPLSIEPMQSVVIQGSDFLPQGSVVFTFGSSSYTARIWNWTNDYILAELPGNVSGIGEMDGNVTVRKQNVMMRADAPIHFIPSLDYKIIRSDPMTYDSLPYDLALALIFFLFTPIRSWCSTYDIYFPDVPSYNLLNGWEIQSLYYESEVAIQLQNEDLLYYIGLDSLPEHTEGSICHGLSTPGKITCVVTIKGALGVPYK
jgi:hypothetical protein